MTETKTPPSLRLTEACWPVFEFITNFVRQVKFGSTPPAEQVRFEGLSALRDAEDLARDDPKAERLWIEKAKAMVVYFVDYKMINTEWDGRNFWFDKPFEIDPQILDHAQALGGEKFFTDCDEMQREFDVAERRERGDRHELAELLSLYFTCLRLGFKGQYHDRPQELADYTRRLFARLPAYSTTRSKEMFPDAYRHNQEVKVDYNLGLTLTVVLVTFFAVFAMWLGVSQFAWRMAVGDISKSATTLETQAVATEIDEAPESASSD